VNALKVPRTRLATSAVRLVTSLVIARTQLPRAPAVVVVDLEDREVDLKSATSAPRSVTLLATAQRLVATGEVDMEVNRADMVVDLEAVEVVVEVDKPATLAAVMAI